MDQMHLPEEYVEGYGAYINGLKIEDCQHSGDAEKGCWVQGWNDAKEDQLDEELPI